MAVKIMIDSASDISEEQAKKKGIVMIPMEINFGEEQYLDGIDLLPNEFYDKLVKSSTLPKTSQINAYRFGEEFKKLTKDGDELVVITISSKLSGTYNSALQAASDFEGKVFVVDSLNACIGERLLGEYALRLAKEGKSAKEIAEELDEKKKKVNVMATLGTLEYLKKGGRISAAVAFAGKLLSLKPVVAVLEGEVKLIGKAMGAKNGNALLNKIVQEKGGFDLDKPYGVIWSGNDDTMLKKFVEDSSKLWGLEKEQVPAHILGATIGTHIGPGAVGVAFFEK